MTAHSVALRRADLTTQPPDAYLKLGLLTLISAFALFISAALEAASAPHATFNEVLQSRVKDGHVDYPSVAQDQRFQAYVQTLSEANPEALSREGQLVFWINAYNAFSIKGILDGGSPSSFFGRVGFFSGRKYNVGGTEINLYDLERDVLIPYDEPRIHFSIVCASASCPKLRSETYSVGRLEAQLDRDAREFINDPTRNRFDAGAKVAYLSKIFDWFKKDFKKHSGSVQKYVAQYVADPAVAEALMNEEYKVKYLQYDWSLNGTPLKDRKG